MNLLDQAKNRYLDNRIVLLFRLFAVSILY